MYIYIGTLLSSLLNIFRAEKLGHSEIRGNSTRREKSKYQSSEADWLRWLCRFCRVWYSQNPIFPKDLGSTPGLGKSPGDEVLNEEVT